VTAPDVEPRFLEMVKMNFVRALRARAAAAAAAAVAGRCSAGPRARKNRVL